jgi:colanic acid/amylovoran biosynthesis glycosyltransferase
VEGAYAVTAPARVAFVMSRFPCYDEAFLLREVRELSRRLDVWVVSLRDSKEPVVHDDARALLPRTVYLPYLLSAELLRAHASFLRARPRRYLRALAHAVLPYWTRPSVLLRSLAFFPKAVLAARWAEREGITHVHGGWATYPATAALVVSELTGLPWSFSGHAHDIYLYANGLAEKVRRAAFVTTCTASNRQFLERLLPDARSKIVLAHHGLRLGDFARVAASESPISILSVATLNPHKGLDVLIDALALLVGRGVDFRATLVGGGPLEEALRRQVADRGLDDRVTLTGALPQHEVARHYARSRVFALIAQPEWHWGIPNVIIEALAARNGVVTTRFGSVEELVEDGKTGLLVPPRDPRAIAAALERLVREPELRQRLADAGHDRVARDFDVARTTERYLELIARAGGGASSRGPEAA